jgi:tRNA pseudouridine38-40 synthase
MSHRLKFTVAYDGAAFEGWQSQSHRNTVQDQLERAFQKICGAPARVHGAGRTDAGVHALAQCAHVGLPNRRLTAIRWTGALNGVLPPTIRVQACRYVSETFHARFSATGKIYRYRIWTGPVLPPLEFKRAWHVSAPLDANFLKSAGEKFVGTHDFAAFSANRSKLEASTVRTIRRVRVKRNGKLVTIEFDGTGFLYKMIRLMVGSMVQIGTGKMEVEEIAQRLRSGRANRARFSAPAEGLYLVKIWY